MRKAVCILGFANKETACRSLSLFAETMREQDRELFIVDNHYPGVESEFWIDWAKKLRGVVLDPGRNLGLHHGLNFCVEQAKLGRDDLLLGADPDTRPLTPAWDCALFDVLKLPGVGWASIGNDHSEGEMRERGYTESVERNYTLWTTKRAVVNSLCGFRLDWVFDSGGFNEPAEFYGGIEGHMFPKCHAKGKRWVWLREFREGKWDNDLSDPEYKAYKWHHAHLGWKGDFAAWLEKGGIAKTAKPV